LYSPLFRKHWLERGKKGERERGEEREKKEGEERTEHLHKGL
jgi:hypothetical protein